MKYNLITKITSDPRVASSEWDQTIDWEDDGFKVHYGKWCLSLKDDYEFDWGGGLAYERKLSDISKLLKCIVKRDN